MKKVEVEIPQNIGYGIQTSFISNLSPNELKQQKEEATKLLPKDMRIDTPEYCDILKEPSKIIIAHKADDGENWHYVIFK